MKKKKRRRFESPQVSVLHDHEESANSICLAAPIAVGPLRTLGPPARSGARSLDRRIAPPPARAAACAARWECESTSATTGGRQHHLNLGMEREKERTELCSAKVWTTNRIRPPASALPLLPPIDFQSSLPPWPLTTLSRATSSRGSALTEPKNDGLLAAGKTSIRRNQIHSPSLCSFCGWMGEREREIAMGMTG
uniref:Uncharacterized protein n=1 Tax=Setaria viridis TaxID=4556 RepID=A0A4U6W2E2_SETVI|nr:hypothetical protein SEVIR_2G375750v2 [Setaria viridis]